MKRTYSYILIGIFLFSITTLWGQMIDGDELRYGNEWIDHNKSYFKIPVANDGIYRIEFQQLIDAGMEEGSISGSALKLHALGKEVSLYLSSESFGEGDYFLFYGRKNRGDFDRYLYEHPDKQLNPEYSLITDTLSYFLCLDPQANNKRIRQEENNLNGTLPDKETHFIHKELLINHSSHFKPTYNGTDKVSYSHLDVPEGFSSPMQALNQFEMPVSHFINNENAKLDFRMGLSTSSHMIKVSINNELIDEIDSSGYSVTDHSYEINHQSVQELMKFEFEGVDFSTNLIDRNTIPVISFSYPRSFDFDGLNQFTFELEPSATSRYLEILGMDVDQSNVRIIDVVNDFLLIPEYDEITGMLRMLLPPSETAGKYVLFNLDSAVVNADIIELLQFIDYLQFDENYIIISNKELRNGENGNDPLEEYAAYRASEQGGGYKTIVVDVSEIYNQFGYGIQRHGQSINNFSNFLYANWSSPEFIYIIGKGRDYVETRTNEQLKDPKNLFFVATYGYHGSDNLMVAPKGDNSPGVPVGRIAVKSPEQISDYLEKIMQHEDYLKYGQSLEEKEWMKKVVHLSGGTPDIQDILRAYLDQMGLILQNNLFGANLLTFGRTSGTATEGVTEQIIKEIEDGTSLISFFGHSGVSTSDFNIGALNNDKFPFFLSLGCYSGDIHTNITTGQSEKFVLSPTGIIGFLGSAGTAYITPQYFLGREFYNQLGGDLYGRSVGEILKYALDINNDNLLLSVRSLNQQLTLHGDPAVRLNPHKGPDYICDYKSVKTNPEIINSNEDRFELTFDVVNIGKWVDDSLSMRIVRTFPNDQRDTLTHKIAAPKYRESVSIELPGGKTKAIGENCIFIQLDPENIFEELEAPWAENNNELANEMGTPGYCFYIINNGAKPISPPEFSIVNDQDVKLRASTYNYFVEEQNYIFQIDTSELFNSPLLRQHIQQFRGGLLDWQPGINMQEETVYYWRVSPDTLNSGLGYLWAGSSFVYLPESSEGWNQSHKYQFEKDDPEGININGWDFEFDDIFLGVDLNNKKYDPQNDDIALVNGEPWGSFNPVNKRPSLCIIGVGPNYFFTNPGADYGHLSHSPYTFCFKTNSIDGRKGVKSLLEDMPDSSVVYVFTVLDDTSSGLEPENWAQDSISLGYNLFSVLESYGAKRVREMEVKGGLPYNFIFKKGYGVLDEKIATNIDDIIKSSVISSVKDKTGYFNSTLIGPSGKWNELLWKESELSDDDQSYLSLYGVNDQFESFIIKDSIKLESLNIQEIDSDQYPYLKLKKYAFNSVSRIPSQMQYWRILFEGLPDAVLIMDESSSFKSDTLDLGDDLQIRATAFNNSSKDLDSLDVAYTIKRADNTFHHIIKKYKPLLANDTVQVQLSVSTLNFPGINEFSIELNPDHLPEEQYYFNNIGVKRFYVQGDIENPLLDVTFDGIHIMDGDIVSPRPEIQMLLKDENAHLLLNDPGVFTRIRLTTPGGQDIDVPIDSEELEFKAAENTTDNQAIMIFRPDLLEEGEYKLTVQATDISNNTAGANEYQVSFRVILSQQISNVYNYPNPFSNSTQFVFTLTGHEIPEFLTIRIMTLSGKVVREISKDELGPLKIGDNITEYSWDGRDQFGEKLANGVYLYEVKAKKATGENYKHLDQGENDMRFFKNGWGKMAILR